MSFDYETVLNKLILSNSVADAIVVLQDNAAIDFVTFHLMNNVSALVDNPFVRTTYPPEWVSYYLLNSLVAKDPIVKAAHNAKKPFIWSDSDLSDPERNSWPCPQDYKIGHSGFSIPHVDEFGRKKLAVTEFPHLEDDEWRAFIDENGEQLVLLATDLHMKGVSEAFAEAEDVPYLSPREYECLKWTSLENPILRSLLSCPCQNILYAPI